jgi:hypothetical protein
MALLKKSMHEMVGVPETALGQAMPVSNTSGVALSIMFQPLMNRYHQKIIQYSHGLQRINEIILLNLAIKEPEMFTWNPQFNTPIKPGQVQQLDPNDPLTYLTYVHFPQPLPLDKLIALNEVQSMLSMGLESKEGALRSLGEEFPAEKIQEIRQELMDDAKADGALQMLKNEIAGEIMKLTGMTTTPDGAPGQPIMDPVTGAPMGGQPSAATPIVDQATSIIATGEQKRLAIEKEMQDIRNLLFQKHQALDEEEAKLVELQNKKIEFENQYQSLFMENAKARQVSIDKAIKSMQALNALQASKTASNAVSGARANGGTVQAGKSYLVGEQGRELFVPQTSGTIVPNASLGGGITINMGGVSVSNEADENRLVEKIKKAFIQEAKLYNL